MTGAFMDREKWMDVFTDHPINDNQVIVLEYLSTIDEYAVCITARYNLTFGSVSSRMPLATLVRDKEKIERAFQVAYSRQYDAPVFEAIEELEKSLNIYESIW